MKNSAALLVCIVISVSLLFTTVISRVDVHQLKKEVAERDSIVRVLEQQVELRNIQNEKWLIKEKQLYTTLDSLLSEKLTEHQREELQQQALQYLKQQHHEPE